MNERGIHPLLIDEEMKNSYLTYSLSVIQSRALPDVCDGLKPSQRRILIAMNDLGLSPGAKFRKCAKIAGDTSGNYHPHGEAVVYPTLVRLAQDWVMRYPLVIPQGNFGNLDGDPPAAMRYTEAKMSHVAMELLEDLDKDTVPHRPNYDDMRQEPEILPGKFPNLICNGSSGIAVGMATSIPPHNLTEVCGAIALLLERPDATVADLMEHVKGPDFPTGAEIRGRSGIRQAYETGNGKVTLRSKTHFEETGNSTSIIVDEIPYLLNKETLIEEIAGLVHAGKLDEISDINDESGRDERVRIVIKVKRGALPDVALNKLFKASQLQRTFPINIMAVHEAEPKSGRQPLTLSLKGLLQHYIDHRKIVIRRRTEFLLAKAEARLHIVAGLLIALDHIEEVIRTIRACADTNAAKEALVARFALSELQADAILRMTLSRLVGMERAKLEEERDALHAEITDLKDILAREERVRGIIKADLEHLVAKFGDARRTSISGDSADLEDEDLIADEAMVVTITHHDYVKRTQLEQYRTQKRGGKGISGADMKEGDFVEKLFIASAHEYLLFFTNLGQLFWLKVYNIPEGARTSRGRAIQNLIQMRDGEKIQSVIPVRTFEDERFLVFVTRQGLIKKTELSAYSNVRTVGIRAIELVEGDELVRVRVCTAADELVIGTARGMSIRFQGTDVRPMGRVARGVIGIRLDPGDTVVDMAVADAKSTLLTVTAHGYGKRSVFEAYRLQGRGGRGVIDLRVTEKTGEIVGMMTVAEGDQLMMITAGGQVIRTPADALRVIGRATQGVRLIRLDENDRLVALASLAEGEGEGEGAAAGTPGTPEVVVDAVEADDDAGADDGEADGDGD